MSQWAVFFGVAKLSISWISPEKNHGIFQQKWEAAEEGMGFHQDL